MASKIGKYIPPHHRVLQPKVVPNASYIETTKQCKSANLLAKFGKTCTHVAKIDKYNEKTTVYCHESATDCTIAVCKFGTDCSMFKKMIDGSYSQNQYIEHVCTYAHRISRSEENYNACMHSLRKRKFAVVRALLVDPTFDLQYSTYVEDDSLDNNDPLRAYEVKQNEAGFNSILHEICTLANYDTFSLALQHPNARIDGATVKAVVNKNNRQFLDAIGPDAVRTHYQFNTVTHHSGGDMFSSMSIGEYAIYKCYYRSINWLDKHNLLTSEEKAMFKMRPKLAYMMFLQDVIDGEIKTILNIDALKRILAFV